MDATVKFLNLPNKWLVCGAHLLSKCIKKMVEVIPLFKNFDARTKYLNESSKFRTFMQETDESCRNVETFLQIRFLTLCYSVNSLISLEGYIKAFHGKQIPQKGNLVHLYDRRFNPFTDQEFTELKQWQDPLNTINQIYKTLEKSRSDGIFIYLLEMCRVILDVCSKVSLIDPLARETLRSALVCRLVKYQQREQMKIWLRIPALLNPDISIDRLLSQISELSHFAEEAESLIRSQLPSNQGDDGVQHVFSERGKQETNDEFTIWRSVAKKRTILTSTAGGIHKSNQSNTLTLPFYWNGFKESFPYLSSIAIKFCCCCATSCDCERLFSRARSCLPYYMGASSLETTDRRLFLVLNGDITLRVMEKSRRLKFSSELSAIIARNLIDELTK